MWKETMQMQKQKINQPKKLYRWIRPEYARFLRSGQKPRTTEEVRLQMNPIPSDNDDGPSRGNYWG